MVRPGHWQRWHEAYEDPASPLSRRLVVVQRRLRDALTAAPGGAVRLVSMCAGQGRDVLGALAGHERRHDVTGRLVELDPLLVDQARHEADRLGLVGIEVVRADAGWSDAYAGAVPADVVLACGVFGNVAEGDVRRTVAELPHLCAAGATVIWTRHRAPPDLTGRIRRWLGDAGFHEVAFDAPPGTLFSVGTARLERPPLPFRPGRRLFTFVGDGGDAHKE